MTRSGRGAGHAVRLLLALAGVLAVLPTSPAAARGSAPGAEEMRTVVVTLRDQVGDADLRAGWRQVHRRSAGAVAATLRSHAEATQAPLLAQVATWRRAGLVRDVRPLWVTNAVALSATPDVLARLAARPDVASVRPDAIRLVPAVSAGTDNQVAVHAPDVWAQGETGAGVVVASLDSGVDVTHPDLAPGYRGGSTGWFDPYQQHATPTDLTGHGTGTLAVAVGRDDSGVTIGTAPGAQWIAARVFDDSGASTVSAVHEAFQWLLDPDGDPGTPDAPQVVNASWSIGSGPGCDLTFQSDVQALRAAGILTVFPAGNFGGAASSSASPGNYPESLTVGAVNANDLIRSDSGRGPSTCGGRSRVFPDVVAPGTNLYTADRYGLYQYLSGTSIAAPHVAGAIALLLAARPGLGPDALEQLVESTATDLGSAGADDTYGHGLLDAAAAYAALPAPEPGFELAVAPTAMSLRPGSQGQATIDVNPTSGFSATVTLSAEGPPGVLAGSSVVPSTVAGGGSGTVTLEVADSAPPGSYPVVVTGHSGALTEQVTLDLTVSLGPPSFLASTAGPLRLPGITGPVDDADVLAWSGTSYRTRLDAGGAGVPRRADVDALEVRPHGVLLLSFAQPLRLPGVGRVQDEDVVRLRRGRWRMFLDGSRAGLTGAERDVDALASTNGDLVVSTTGNRAPPGVKGTADDADLYRWDGTRFTRFFDASAAGVPAPADVDALELSGGAVEVSFTAAVTLPDIGRVQDEDVVRWRSGHWTVVVDGSTIGLGGSAAGDLDALAGG
ncbi:MAG: S8 family serine peptidase [Nocardioidaceae bacterium]|nr:S8 family serine peptidase [Nocardioidaceae bacterium]